MSCSAFTTKTFSSRNTLRIFNSLFKKITALELFSAAVAKTKKKPFLIYLCGPTVYDHVHIGNLRPVLTIDLLIRLFTFLKIPFVYVSNLTDIDDKIIKRSLELQMSENAVAEKYISAYQTILQEYGVIFPHSQPRVTGYIEQIISFISLLLQQQKAYLEKEEVFFNLSAVETYGELSGQRLTALQRTAERTLASASKKEDFVLWKKKQRWD